MEDNEINRLVAHGMLTRLGHRVTLAEDGRSALALVTGLVPLIGHDRAAALVRRAYDSRKTIRQVAREQNLVSEEALTEILGPPGSE